PLCQTTVSPTWMVIVEGEKWNGGPPLLSMACTVKVPASAGPASARVTNSDTATAAMECRILIGGSLLGSPGDARLVRGSTAEGVEGIGPPALRRHTRPERRRRPGGGGWRARNGPPV